MKTCRKVRGQTKVSETLVVSFIMSIVQQRGERGGRRYLVKINGNEIWMRRSEINEDLFESWSGEEEHSVDTYLPKRRKVESPDPHMKKEEVYKCSNSVFKQKCNLLLVKSVHRHLGDTRPFNNTALILDGPDGQTAFHLTMGTNQFLCQNIIIPNRVQSTCEELKASLAKYQKPCQVIPGEAYQVLKDHIKKKELFSLVYLDWCGMTDEKTLDLLFSKGLQENAIVAFTASYRNWSNHMKKTLKKCHVASNTFLMAIKEWFQQLVEKHGYTLQHLDMDLNSSGGVGFWLAYVTY